jgi:hypothetical protein
MPPKETSTEAGDNAKAKKATDEQCRFLISCIRFSQGGRIDHEKVADDCGIISKAAR